MNKNKIPQGYKDSPLGIIPENWEVKRLGEVFNTLKSFSFSRNQMTSQKQELRYIHYGDIHTGAEQDSVDLSLGTLPYILNDLIPVEKIKDENFPLLKNGDIILADASEDYDGIGKAWEILNTANNKIIAGLHTIVLRERTNYTSIGYGRYLFRNTQTSKSLKRIAQGTKVYSISYKHLSKLHLLFPPLSEQQKIAEILSCWDEAIEKQTQLIEKLETRKRGLMQQLLTGKKRIKGFENEWKKIELGSVATINRGGSPRPIKKFITSKETGINWIKIGDVDEGAKFIERTKEKIIEEGVLKSRQVFKGDFLLSNSMSFGRPYILKIDGCIHDGWLVIQDYSNAFNIDYLFYVLGFETTLSQYKSLAAGSGVLNLNKEKVKMVVLFHPSIEEQTAIANILSIADDEIQKEMELLTALRSQKKGLMQQLLTGKKRVKI